MAGKDTTAKASGGQGGFTLHPMLTVLNLDCPDPGFATGGASRSLGRKASYSRGSSSTRGGTRGRGRGGKKAAAKPRSKTGAFRAADD